MTEEQYLYEERAAIMEYCGNLSREEAERLALQENPDAPVAEGEN